LDWDHQNQNLDPIRMLDFCIDKKYLKWWIDDVLEKTTVFGYNYLKNFYIFDDLFHFYFYKNDGAS
jgi:hypothetical protein